jgi:hypothetical protein
MRKDSIANETAGPAEPPVRRIFRMYFFTGNAQQEAPNAAEIHTSFFYKQDAPLEQKQFILNSISTF